VLRGLFWTGAWLFGLVVLAGVTLRQLTGDEIFLGRYTGYVMPWLGLGLGPIAAAAAASRRPALAVVACASLVAIVATHVARPRPPAARPVSGTPLAVMSFNTWSRNDRADLIAALVRRHQPDLLLVQEIRPEVFAVLLAELRGLYGGAAVHHVFSREILQGIVTRHPIQSWAVLKAEGQALKAVVRAPSGPITVYNVHVMRQGGWRSKRAQISALLDREVLRQDTPVVVGGDFNAPEHSEPYALLARHLANAHDVAGAGLGFTFPTPAVRLFGVLPVLSMVRLDHVFFGGKLAAIRAGTIEDHAGSDHRPVYADLVFPP
jgi:vancomycin resistance protein VanJ